MGGEADRTGAGHLVGRGRLGAVLGALLLAACSGAVEPSETGTVRLALEGALPAGVDEVAITLHGPDGILSTAEIGPPWPADLVVAAPPGPDRRVELVASIGGLPAWSGISAPVEVRDGELVEVEVVLDPAGLLIVRPLGIDPPDLLSVEATADAPPPGRPAAYTLAAGADGHSAVLPAGRYALRFTLAPAVADLAPAGSTRIEVLPGVRNEWVEPFVAPDVPAPGPGPAVRLELEVPGGRLVGGLTRQAADLVVRARDDAGRIATGYRGTVRFEADAALEALLPAALPDPYTFTEADAGEHRFAAGLLPSAASVTGLLRLTVRDDDGLEASIELPVVSLP